MASILLGQPVAEVEGRLSVRLAHIAPAPPRVQEFDKRFRLRTVSTLYGMTEAMIFPPDPSRAPVLGIIGTAPTDWDVAILDPLGHPVTPGEAGELVARPRRSFILFDGYLDMPAQTVDAWRGLWYHTGDVCRCDEDGVYWFMGRTRDVIRRGGENVSAWEIESIVGGYTELSEAAAVPIAGNDGEEEVALFAKRREGSAVTEAEIRAYCTEVLPRFMRPDHVTVQDSDLPKTQSGKIDKVALRAGFERARAHRSTA